MPTPLRILVSTPTGSAWETPEPAVLQALDLLKKKKYLEADQEPQYRLLAVERWQRIFIVFDLFHDQYDPDKAHLEGQSDLDVVVVSLRGNTITVANDAIKAKVNENIRNFHDWHGIGSRPPFMVDHANGHVPTYPLPRTLIRSTSKTPTLQLIVKSFN